MKSAVIDGATAILGPAEDVDKTVVPQNLMRQIRCPRMHGLDQSLIDAAGGDNEFGVEFGEHLRGPAAQRALGVNLVHHGESQGKNWRTLAYQFEIIKAPAQIAL